MIDILLACGSDVSDTLHHLRSDMTDTLVGCGNNVNCV